MGALRDCSGLANDEIKILLLGVEQTQCRTRAALLTDETKMLLQTFARKVGVTLNSLLELWRLWPTAASMEAPPLAPAAAAQASSSAAPPTSTAATGAATAPSAGTAEEAPPEEVDGDDELFFDSADNSEIDD